MKLEKTFYEKLIPSLKVRAIATRFFKAFISGSLSAISLMTIAMPQSWTDVPTLLSMLALSGLYGGLTGIFMGGQKWWVWED